MMHRSDGKLSRDDALAKIREKRQIVRPNDGFLRQLAAWQAGLQLKREGGIRIAPNQVAGHIKTGLPSLIDGQGAEAAQARPRLESTPGIKF